MASIWLADGEQIVIISSRMWNDPGAWGLMLVDFAQHVANAYAERGLDPDLTLANIKAAMEAEWVHPTN